MHHLRVRLHVAEDGTITGHAPVRVPIGEHDAELVMPLQARVRRDPAKARQAIRALQDELARLPVLDPREPEEIMGYDENGSFS